MIKWLKKLVNSKISITINVTQPGVDATAVEEKYWPAALVMPAPVVVSQSGNGPLTNKSYRFTHDYKKSSNGKEEEFWYTESYTDNHWKFVSGSLSHIKNDAMDLHIKLMSNIAVEPIEKKTVLWENMPIDQVRTWVGLLKSEE